jgi:hypothetical protein
MVLDELMVVHDIYETNKKILNIFTGVETKVLEFATSCLCLGRGCQCSTLAKRPREA